MEEKKAPGIEFNGTRNYITEEERKLLEQEENENEKD